jgi:signal transduction histidine kinase
VSNAVKYNRDGGRVDVTVSGTPQGATLEVNDTGIGMTKDETAKLFGEFVRIKNAKTRNIMGSGLGLSIVRKLATLYGGDVTVASQPDVGTTFTVHLSAATTGNDVG